MQKKNKKIIKTLVCNRTRGREWKNTSTRNILRRKRSSIIIEKWKYGYVFIGTFVNERTVNYITKYMLKDDINNREFSGKVLASPGIGAKYFEREDWKFNKYREEDTREYYVFRNGAKAMLPKYYREKIHRLS